MKLSDVLVRQAIITDLQATTTEGAIYEIVDSVQNAGHLAGADSAALAGSFLEREKLGSTAIGKGVACPHGGHKTVDRVFGTIVLSRPGVEFNAIDGKPVHIILPMFHTPDQFLGQPIKPGGIYDAWKAVIRYFKDDHFLERLRCCRTGDEVFDLFVHGDYEAP